MDGLRGVAALVVVLQHLLLTVPAVADAYRGESALGVGSALWWLTSTPLHLVWAGEEAVLVFFVLSGLVLALPATRTRLRLGSYYPKRLVRLYLPVWASLVVAVALVLLLPREADPGYSWYVNSQADLSVGQALHDAVLLDGAGLLNGPLWSLQWEMLFSLLLPAYLLLATTWRTGLAVKVVLLVALIAVGTLSDSSAMRFLPMFGLGVLMAFHLDLLERAAAWLSSRPHPQVLWSLLATATLVLVTARWTVGALPATHPLLSAAGSGGSLVGAALAVFLAMHWDRARAVLLTRPAQWLGLVSFSLYLVHVPVIVTAAFLLPVGIPAWVTLAGGVPLAVGAAAVFYRLAEGPAHLLSQRVGRWSAGRA